MNTQNTARQRLARWDPFRALDTEADARQAAKSGVWPAAYFLVIAAFFVAGRLALGFSFDLLSALAVAVVALLAFLAWRIWYRQGRWSILVVAFLFGLKVLLDLAMATSSKGQHLSLFFYVLAGGATIASVRGCWRLHHMARRAKVDATVFD